jgi:hypothetical protein
LILGGVSCRFHCTIPQRTITHKMPLPGIFLAGLIFCEIIIYIFWIIIIDIERFVSLSSYFGYSYPVLIPQPYGKSNEYP